MDTIPITPLNPALLIHGDSRTALATLPAASVDMVVTSPPYYALRDYDNSGQIGLEETVDGYVDALGSVFDQCRRVLSSSGTFWLNVGDTYKDGSPLGVPWRLAFDLQRRGWLLRSEIIWHKPNAMPESVKDRPSRAHEHIFLFSKTPDYYYDWYAITELTSRPGEVIKLGVKSLSKRSANGSGVKPTGNALADTYTNPERRNSRSVWTISTEGDREAHFAVFPTELVSRMVMAGTSGGGYCIACGSGSVRNVETKRRPTRPGRNIKADYDQLRANNAELSFGNRDERRHVTDYTDKGFKLGCSCPFPVRSGIVLDPFVGSGTAAAVSIHLGRMAIGIDCNLAYLKIARSKIGTALQAMGGEYTLPRILRGTEATPC